MSYVEPGYPRLTYSQLESVWIKAGGSKAMAPLMAAIALAESSGIAGNTNPTDNSGTQTSWGLWQISDGTHGWSYGGDPYDPVNNARVAIMKLHSQGLTAWGTYSSGAYKTYYKGSVPPSQNIPSGPNPGPTQGGFSGGFGQGVEFANFAGFDSNALTAFPDLNPVHAVESIVGDVGGLIKNAFGWEIGAVKTLPDAMKAISKAIGVIGEVFAGFLWLLNPANDLRVIAGFTGLIVLGLAIYLVATA